MIIYNVNGLANEKKRRKIFNYLHDHKFDLIFMQETHSIERTEKVWISEWGSKIIFSYGSSSARGVALLISRKMKCDIQKIVQDPEGRFLLVEITLDNIKIVCTVIYAPNVDDSQFFAKIFNLAEEMEGRKIFAGDFNTVLSLKYDLHGGKGYSHPKTTEFLNEYISQNELIDIWILSHGEEFKSTFVRKESTIASLFMESIDYILIEASLVQYAQNVGILPAFASDHATPHVTFAIEFFPPGPGYWKFNNALLHDDEFIQEAVKVITDILSDTTLDLFDRWELMKFSVKQTALKRSINKARSQRGKLDALTKKLVEVENSHDKLKIDDPETIHLFNDHEEKIHVLKEEINHIYEKKTAGAMLRSCATWYECAEKPTKYFFSLEKSQYAKKTISRMRDHNGDIIDDSKHILHFLNRHFTKLFSSIPADVEPDMEYLATLNIPQVSEYDAAWLDAPIQLEEIHLALKAMNLNKCPGTDGLTTEFYLKFWPMIATTMCKLFQTIANRKLLHKSAREAITSLMPKIGRIL